MNREGVPYIDYLPDNSAEALATYPALANRCKDCAYTPGTSASLTPTTARIAAECAESRCAFWCHKSLGDNGLGRHLCAGWVESLAPPPEGKE